MLLVLLLSASTVLGQDFVAFPCLEKCLVGVTNNGVLNRATCDAALVQQAKMFACVSASACTDEQKAHFNTVMKPIQLSHETCDKFEGPAAPAISPKEHLADLADRVAHAVDHGALNEDGSLSSFHTSTKSTEQHDSRYLVASGVFVGMAVLAVGVIFLVAKARQHRHRHRHPGTADSKTVSITPTELQI